MKRVLTLIAVLAMGLSLAQVRVGIAFDAGGKFDRSFNQSAWEGAQKAAKELRGQSSLTLSPPTPPRWGRASAPSPRRGLTW
jgi:basic membrane protein A